jgi:hypothetical protein
MEWVCRAKSFSLETHHHNVEGRLRNLENSNRQLEDQNIEIREKLLALQTHSMKNNLICFTRSLVSDMLEYIICGVTVFIELVGSDIIWLGFCTNGICMVGIVELNTPGGDRC